MKALWNAVGGLSTPSKMPGFAYGLPARECKLGSILRNRKGSVCNKCYALKGMYVFPNVQAAQYNRLRLLENNLPAWTRDMIELIRFKYRNKYGAKHRVFRWHDSGDIQSPKHLAAIVEIARTLPSVRFWSPTRERVMVQDYLREYPQGFPKNLVVRISATMVGRPTGPLPIGTVGSTVGAKVGRSCPAYSQGGQCGDCRSCWNPRVANVDYPLH